MDSYHRSEEYRQLCAKIDAQILAAKNKKPSERRIENSGPPSGQQERRGGLERRNRTTPAG